MEVAVKLADIDRDVMTIPEFARVAHAGRNTFYDLARTKGEIWGVPVYRSGRRMLVSRRAVEKALEEYRTARDEAA